MNPGDRPRRTVLALLGAVAATAVVSGIVVVAGTEPAAAGDLERFASCEALAEWGDGATGRPEEDLATTDGASRSVSAAPDAGSGAGGDDAAEGGTAASGGERSAEAAPMAADQAAGGDGDATNVIVEGVDELDVVDRLDDTHVLVAAASRLSIVDLVEHRIVASLPVPAAVEATYDRERGIAWVVGPDDAGRLTVARVAVTASSLAEEAKWDTDGWLVDARRVGDRLHLVAADGYAGDIVPFASEPVPCDDVLHPVGPSEPTATLLVTLPATGELVPEHATEVVGSGEHVHVTTEAAYLATPVYGDAVRTGLHRFDLDDLALTGSGSVDGVLLNEFSLSDFEGHLRVAVTDGSGRRGMAIEDGAAAGVAVDPVPSAAPDGALNEVVVLDTEGALDVVGRTPRFGHPGETIQGVRFDGAVGYAVTFLQTDPFYVLDLAEPARPQVAGEVQLPGFSSYLHPVADGFVAGFGPGEDGRVAVKLFDVSDRAAPKVVDTYVLGEESPVAWDHHAFVDLGEGRFAVPASTYREVRPTSCTPQRQKELRAAEARVSRDMEALWGRSGGDGELAADDQARLEALQREHETISTEGCLYPVTVPESSVVVLDAGGGRLEQVERLGAVRRAGTGATRVVPTPDGWALLVGNHWVALDATGAEEADLELGPMETARLEG